jgi:hypothetical protein
MSRLLANYKIYLVYGIGIAAASLAGIIVLLGFDACYAPRSAGRNIPLAATSTDANKKLPASVNIEVVYFIPKNMQDRVWPDWKTEAEKALQQMQAFHQLQFNGASKITYNIKPDPIIGEQDNYYYDGSDTHGGNLHAWGSVKGELERRLGASTGSDSHAINARLVLYEGVGAMGGKDFILVSSGYLRSKYMAPVASSVIYHELGHVLGLEDKYDSSTGTPFGEDIMGSGREHPIEETYISNEEKRELGM